jgi:hypothetical protein
MIPARDYDRSSRGWFSSQTSRFPRCRCTHRARRHKSPLHSPTVCLFRRGRRDASSYFARKQANLGRLYDCASMFTATLSGAAVDVLVSVFAWPKSPLEIFLSFAYSPAARSFLPLRHFILVGIPTISWSLFSLFHFTHTLLPLVIFPASRVLVPHVHLSLRRVYAFD